MGYDTLLERAFDGVLMKVHFADGSVLESYKEKQELEAYNKAEINTVHVLRRFDHAVVKIKENGEIVLLTSNAWHYLNNIGMNLQVPKDKDYLFEINGTSTERRTGVYTTDLFEGKIWTKDDEGNILIIKADGQSIEKMAVSFDLDQNAETLKYKWPNSPKGQKDGEYIEEECKFLPPPKTVRPPWLIYIQNDGSAQEFLNAK